MNLVKNTLYRAANMALKPEGQFHDRLSDLLSIVIQGWDTGQSHTEIAEKCWEAIKNDAPKLRDKLAFVVRGLEAGWGGGDFLAWMKQGGDWDDPPSILPTTRPTEGLGRTEHKAIPGGPAPRGEGGEAPEGRRTATVHLRLEETLQGGAEGSDSEES